MSGRGRKKLNFEGKVEREPQRKRTDKEYFSKHLDRRSNKEEENKFDRRW
jgi:hypothetical protein